MLSSVSLICLGLLLGLTGWTFMLRRQMRKLRDRAVEAEARYHEFMDQAEHGGAVRRKIEAQLLEKQQRLDRLAHHDQLTGLPNRLFLAAHLPVAMEEARRNKLPLAVLFMDLDRFKHVNDTYGHETGDKLLQAVAQRVKEAVRADDIVVRMGGDEFVVILGTLRTAEQVNETASRITATLNSPIVIDGKPLVTTVSVGVSLYPRDGEDVGSLLRHSDTAMYQAKERGRNNFQIFNPVMDRKLKERVAIEARMRDALEASRFDVHYQPLIEIETRRVVALEALIRWKDPEEGFISPARFIPVAEETGLIVPLGDFVLQRVTAHLVARFEASSLGLLETYPGEIYPIDNTSFFGALAVHDRATGEDHGALRARLLEGLERHRDPHTGLLVQSVSPFDGAPVVRGLVLPAAAPAGTHAQALVVEAARLLAQPAMMACGIGRVEAGVAALGDLLARQLAQEARRDGGLPLVEDAAVRGEGDVGPLARARQADIGEPALFLQTRQALVVERALVGEQPFLPAGEEDGVEFQALGGVQRHDAHCRSVGVDAPLDRFGVVLVAALRELVEDPTE